MISDAALLADCARTGTAFVPFFPLGGGLDPIDTTRLEETAAGGLRKSLDNIEAKLTKT